MHKTQNSPIKSTIHGWLAIDKPAGISSHTVVARARKILGVKKIGHAGTLDPFATGMLLIAIGEATKTIQYAMDMDKSYDFTVNFSHTTDTYDLTGEVTERSAHLPTPAQITSVLGKFRGPIEQIPPIYSAIKVNGQRSYDMARKGVALELAPRNVTIHRLEITGQPSESEFSFTCDCSKGTYIRSLGYDIARKLAVFGHISALRRTRIGKFTDVRMISLENLEELVHNDALFKGLMPVDIILDDILVITVDQHLAQKLHHGQTIEIKDRGTNDGPACVKADNKLLAIGITEGNYFKPSRVFNI